MKPKTEGGGSVRDIKAAELDRVVKAELAKKRAATAGKMSRLRALRLARDADQERREAGLQSSAKTRKAKRPSEN